MGFYSTNGWADIGYNFCVGDPGQIYEGRGYGRQGAHAPGFNQRALGHCFFGEHTSVLPTSAALTNTQNFITCSRNNGFLTSGHWVSTHRGDRQSSTACPGNALHNQVINVLCILNNIDVHLCALVFSWVLYGKASDQKT
jgi:peptidoglycan recognition protein